MLLGCMLAMAGDTALYQKAIGLLQSNYLYEQRLDQQKMFVEAGQQLELKIEWLLVTEQPGALLLQDGQGWSMSVPFSTDIVQSLAALEDAVWMAKHPVDPKLDIRIEILKGLVRPLDRHTVVLAGDSLERFDERISGTLYGVGATIGPDPKGNLIVKGLFPGSPAEKGGLLIGDIIRLVDGVSTVGMTTADATDRIRGEAGTVVALTVDRQGERLVLNLSRAELSIPNVESYVTDQGLGVVKIDHFSEKTSIYLDSSMRELGDERLREGLAIDLRGNTGGSLIQSALAADVFIQEGLLVATLGRNGATVRGLVPEILARPDPADGVGPVVVLMDPSTASGSEILAGALAEADRALLIGEPSFGKGTVQKTYLIGPSIKLKMTVAEYRLAHDRVVADVGLAPDLVVSPFVVGETGAWYADRRRLLARIDEETTPILPWIKGDDDFLLYAAARLVAAAQGLGRDALFTALHKVLPELYQEANTRLVEALRQTGLDWSMGSPVAPDVGVSLVSGTVQAGVSGKVVFQVQNRGGELSRVALRLAAVNPLWEDRVILVGRLKAGEVRQVELSVLPERGPGRVDPVTIWLEQDERSVREVWSGQLQTRPSLPLGLRVEAVYQSCAPCEAGQVSGVQLSIKSEESLAGGWAKFEFPEVPGMELLQERSETFDLKANKPSSVFLGVRTGEQFQGSVLPLTLVIGDASGRIVRWDMPVSLDNSPIFLSAPRITLTTPVRQVPGLLRLAIRAEDDHKIDHVLVFAGTETVDRSRATASVVYKGDKLAWQQGGSSKVRFEVEVPVVEGLNRYTILAEDDLGLVSAEVRYVLGSP